MSDKYTIYQYWDAPTPPPEVDRLINTWAFDKSFNHELYDYESARSFIKSNFEKSTLTAFEKCLVPAMQADFFRYCILFKESGIYIDADTENGGGLGKLVGGVAKKGLLMERHGNIANDFIFLKESGSSLLSRVVRKAEKNIREEASNNVWKVTGPGIMTSLFNSESEQSIFKDYEIASVRVIRKSVFFKWDLAYKSKEQDWRAFGENDSASIFR